MIVAKDCTQPGSAGTVCKMMSSFHGETRSHGEVCRNQARSKGKPQQSENQSPEVYK